MHSRGKSVACELTDVPSFLRVRSFGRFTVNIQILWNMASCILRLMHRSSGRNFFQVTACLVYCASLTLYV